MMSLLAIAALVAVALAFSDVEVLVTGLNDPRFVTFANNRLYVTEGGTEANNNVLTRTGSVKEIRRESSDDDDDDHKLHVRTLLTLDSYAESDEGSPESNGPSGVAVHDGRLYVCSQSFDLAGLLDAHALTPADAARELTFGKIIAVDLSEGNDDDDSHERRTFTVGHPGQAGLDATTVGDSLNVLGAWRQPEGPDTDPYGIYYDDRDDTIYVANAASNLLQAVKDGRTRTVAFFPATSLFNSSGTFVPVFSPTTGYASVNITEYGGDATPTGVTRGPDGYLYVTTLEFVQSLAGPAANVYRIDPRADNHQVSSADIFASGFKMLTDIHYSKHHNAFFLVEQRVNAFADSFGDVVRIELSEHHDHDHNDDDDDDHHDSHSAVKAGTVTRYGVGVLSLPNGVTTDDDGRVYVVDGATGAQTGRLLRIK